MADLHVNFLGMDNLNKDNNDDDSSMQLEDIHQEGYSAKQDETKDKQSLEKQKARRRLIGAVVLVILSIVIVPFVFDSKPRTAFPDLVIFSQGQENVIKGTVSEESTPVSKSDTTNQASQKTELTQAQPDQAAANQTVAPAKPEIQNEPVVNRPAQSNEEKSKDQVAEKVKPKAETPKVNAKNADPLGQMIAEKNKAKIIQVAALGSDRKASELKTKLARAGFKVQSQKVKLANGQQRIRIRVGPYKDTKAVNKACAKLKTMNLSCTLVN